MRDSAWKWIGDAGEEKYEYGEVDKRREMGGKIIRTEIISGGEGDSEERKVVVEIEDKV